MISDFEIIVVSHGDFAKGLLDSIGMILNEDVDDFHWVSLEMNESIESFDDKIKNKLEIFDDEKNIIILVDLLGGTPMNTCIKYTSKKIDVIVGVNLALALDLYIKKTTGVSYHEFNLNQVVDTSSKSILYLNEQMKLKGDLYD